MKTIQVVTPTEESEKITKVLSDSGRDFSIISGKENTLILITSKEEDVEDILQDLKRTGVGREFGRINLSPVSATLPSIMTKRPLISFQRSSNDEIIQMIEKSTKINVNYFALIALAGVLASIGLLGNNAAVIIGSMVIAPLLGPVTGTAMGTILSRRKMFEDSIKLEAAGIIIAVVVGLVLTYLYPGAAPTSEILARAQPNLADIALAIASGFAAGVAISGGLESALVGVAVAAALLPPAANIGIGLALAQYSIASGSLQLLLVNILSINICCTALFWLQGIRPAVSIRKEKVAARILRRRLIVVLIALLVLTIPIGITTQNLLIQARYTNVVNSAVYAQALPPNNAIIGNVETLYDPTTNILWVNFLMFTPTGIPTNLAQTLSLVISLGTGIPTITVVTGVNATILSILW
ncbi:MAG: TIGR00341 family protein [Candidatus Jordarchaeum sp.]|uniref:TIGR00341 family protein n=1 Tax=Candidatus Jordarchaeum sp. TaxID=2823881 RepID=UPI00404997DC